MPEQNKNKQDHAVDGQNERLVMPAANEIVAIRYKDNCMGDGQIINLLAYVDRDNKWISEDSMIELLQYEGDEVIEWWSITPGTGNKAA